MPNATASRFLLWTTLALASSIAWAGASSEKPGGRQEAPWSFETLIQRAQACARQPYEASPPLPKPLRMLDYDRYRMIAFEHAAAIWKSERSPLALECFHRGYLFSDRVALNIVEDGRQHPVPFDRRMFQYRGSLSELMVPDDFGFAGFRVLGRFESSPHLTEVASFLGASYFRAIAEGQVYGTSARGLAVDVGLPKAEEFPVFREYWIERPQAEASMLRFWALLDSPSVAGAYEFNLRPGKKTRLDVRVRLFFRRTPDKVGLAPLTSMWMWGDGRNPPPKDSRPKVHDSDGLLIRTSDDQWVWRPLSRQSYPSLSRFDFTGIRGFGLVQRDRRTSSFLDDEAKYHLRPTVWIEPKQGWSDGAVELLELPAEHEGIDNIAAWWKPNKPVELATPVDLEYSVLFMSGEPQRAVARAVGTRVKRHDGGPIRLEVDFAGDRLARLPADVKVTSEVQALRGDARNIVCANQADGLWQLSFDVYPAGAEPVELRASLSKNGEELTETWRYLCPS